MKREQIRKDAGNAKQKQADEAAQLAEDDAAVAAAQEPNPEAEALKDDMDDLLDEIDGVLETNAEEFLKNYIQKGGQ